MNSLHDKRECASETIHTNQIIIDDAARALLSEYQALRGESLHSAQIIATTLWVGISGFAVTVGAGFAAIKAHPVVLPLAMGFLCLQALAASGMLLAEIWKYARIGSYIRSNIEARLAPKEGDKKGDKEGDKDNKRLLNWEHWIADKRPKWFYFLSLLLLQSPVLVIVSLLASFQGGVSSVCLTITSLHAQLGARKDWIYILLSIAGAELLVILVTGLVVFSRIRELNNNNGSGFTK